MPRKRSERCRLPASHPARSSTAFEGRGSPLAHALACPPPWEQYAAPLRVRRVMEFVRGDCGGGPPHDRPWPITLPVAVDRQAWPPRAGPEPRTAVLVRDARVALEIGWKRLRCLADERPVLLSLAAFAAAANASAPGTAVLRVARRRNRPLCAMVCDSSFITRGFALNDVFCYAWKDATRGLYLQQRIVCGPRLTAFCRRERLVAVLTADSPAGRGTDHPLLLHRTGRRGFLVVADIEPPAGFEAARPVRPYHARLLGQMLGWTEPYSGQYAVSPACRQEFEQIISLFCDRFPPARWVPAKETRNSPPFGWMSIPARTIASDVLSRPQRTIRIRTGFAADQWDVVMGVLMCLKQMLGRPTCASDWMAGPPSGFAIQWIPLCNPRAMPPPAAPDEYSYMIAVPPEMRRRQTPQRPDMPDVRIDLTRASGKDIVLHHSARHLPQVLRQRLKTLSDSLGVHIAFARLPAAPGGRTFRWKLGFPVEHDPAAYDSIAATDRVVRVLRAVLAGCCGTR